ncbi:uncharacterized protein BX664DRAFT_324222, partial [Halteromyces radiatus]|uniref:uncharacterized protein n=1 Tax=Halteromyces radiatus TaxID=101107 RepID=UPI00221E8E85
MNQYIITILTMINETICFDDFFLLDQLPCDNPVGSKQEEFRTVLDPETFQVHTLLGTESVEVHPLFEEVEQTATFKGPEEKTEDSEINGCATVSNKNVYDNPFYQPKPFKCNPEDRKELLSIMIPSYLYQLSLLKEQQQKLAKEEKEHLFPLVTNLLHDNLDEPVGQLAS